MNQLPHMGCCLVGGFNPFEKYQSKWESSPTRGVNEKISETSTQLSIGLHNTIRLDEGFPIISTEPTIGGWAPSRSLISPSYKPCKQPYVNYKWVNGVYDPPSNW